MWAPVQGVCLTKRAVTNLTCTYCIVTFQPTSYKYLFSGSRPLNGHPYKNKNIQLFTWEIIIQPNLSCFYNDRCKQCKKKDNVEIQQIWLKSYNHIIFHLIKWSDKEVLTSDYNIFRGNQTVNVHYNYIGDETVCRSEPLIL